MREYLPTEEEIVESTFAILRQLPEAVLDKATKTAVGNVMNSDMSLKGKQRGLIRVADQFSALIAPMVPCKSGCSHCCKQSVSVTSAEAEAIGKHINVRPSKVQGMQEMLDEHPTLDAALAKLQAKVEGYIGVPCVFLSGAGTCEIYEHRPLVCRGHHNLSAYPAICDTVEHPGHATPAIDLTVLWDAAATICVREGSANADIREFFPAGRHG